MARQLPELRAEYCALQALDLSLDLTRGKPSPQQLALSEQLLALPGLGKDHDASGIDVRNYGGVDGGLQIRRIFAELFGVPVDRFLALANGSLRLMHDSLMFAMLFGVPGSSQPWVREQGIKFICPVPGYDRHHGICEALGIEMITVPMLPTGPDADAIAALVAQDPSIKGMWVVPTYSNPTGYTVTQEVARQLVSMPTAAPDFRIMWDDAYALHHLKADVGDHAVSAKALDLAQQAGNPDRVLLYASTSKVSFAGSGVAFFGASDANIAWMRTRQSVQTIGPDKINHLRHAMFFGSADGVREHMTKHREIMAPKFEAVSRVLGERLGGQSVARWTNPAGGYFVSLDVLPGTASRVVQLAAQAGVALTPAGATFPYGHDPLDSNIRLAPSMPALADVEVAMGAVATCVLLAEAEAVSQG